MNQPSAPHDPLLTYALETYSLPGVGPACLLLQDILGVDVTVLLYAMYLANHRQVILDDEGLAAADSRVVRWRSQVVAPLRALRRRMKECIDLVPPEAADTRELVKQAELRAELTAFAILWRFVDSEVTSEHSCASYGRMLLSIAAMYASRNDSCLSISDDAIQQALQILESVAKA